MTALLQIHRNGIQQHVYTCKILKLSFTYLRHKSALFKIGIRFETTVFLNSSAITRPKLLTHSVSYIKMNNEYFFLYLLLSFSYTDIVL